MKVDFFNVIHHQSFLSKTIKICRKWLEIEAEVEPMGAPLKDEICVLIHKLVKVKPESFSEHCEAPYNSIIKSMAKGVWEDIILYFLVNPFVQITYDIFANWIKSRMRFTLTSFI